MVNRRDTATLLSLLALNKKQHRGEKKQDSRPYLELNNKSKQEALTSIDM